MIWLPASFSFQMSSEKPDASGQGLLPEQRSVAGDVFECLADVTSPENATTSDHLRALFCIDASVWHEKKRLLFVSAGYERGG